MPTWFHDSYGQGWNSITLYRRETLKSPIVSCCIAQKNKLSLQNQSAQPKPWITSKKVWRKIFFSVHDGTHDMVCQKVLSMIKVPEERVKHWQPPNVQGEAFVWKNKHWNGRSISKWINTMTQKQWWLLCHDQEIKRH